MVSVAIPNDELPGPRLENGGTPRIECLRLDPIEAHTPRNLEEDLAKEKVDDKQ
jgi:hypothetical protein